LKDLAVLDLVKASFIGEAVLTIIHLLAISGLGDRTGSLFNLLVIPFILFTILIIKFISTISNKYMFFIQP
jgi:hypothetical protein